MMTLHPKTRRPLLGSAQPWIVAALIITGAVAPMIYAHATQARSIETAEVQ